MKYCILDLETHADTELADAIDLYSYIKPNGNIKNEELKAKNVAEKIEKLKDKLALEPEFAIPKLATIKLPDELIIIRNFNLDPDKEKRFIEKVVNKYLGTAVAGGTETGHVVTFNGKKYDIPILFHRGQLRRADINYRNLISLLDGWKDKTGHLDLCEYSNGSLDLNLRRLFGSGKLSINFNEVDNADLELYSIDEILKLENWYRLLQGYPLINYDYNKLIGLRGVYHTDQFKVTIIE